LCLSSSVILAKTSGRPYPPPSPSTGMTTKRSSSFPRTSVTGEQSSLHQTLHLTRRGSRFSCTPYYPHAPDPPNPVPPVPANSTPQNTPTPELVKRYAGQSSGDVPIWKSIQYMDHEGMDLLRSPARDGAVEEWESYLARTKASNKHPSQ
jgi:hypothetical protein